MLSFLYVYSHHSILECYNLFSGVELSMRSFFVIFINNKWYPFFTRDSFLMIGPISNCWGLDMVGHKVAGSWLGAACVAPGGGEGHLWRFTDKHLCRASERSPPSPGELPVRGGRGGVAPWVADGEPSISFLSSLCLPVQGLGTRRGESRASSPRVVGSKCSLMLPSGCQTTVPEGGGKTAPTQENLQGRSNILLGGHW